MPQKETRKLVAIGNSLGVTLPKGWIDYFDLKLGDKLEVITNGNVTLKPKQSKKKGT
ncbi:MAG: AbrB/MazE/SpoVT family DNA-binding domain-containing protein [Candidatus Bathyarchaeota archaeon]|nr:AbrB/MazE/SpoVT family DNA-binding domain-containing protein [Candidatus Bathyarchaeum sp.]